MSETGDPWGRFEAVSEPKPADPWSRFESVGGQQGPRPAGPSTGESVAMGLADPVHGGAQMLTHALPTGIVGAVNSATAYVNDLPVIGPVTRALGMVPSTPEQIDTNIATRERDYQSRRAAAGETGTDWGRVGGRVIATAPAALALPTGGSIGGAFGFGAATGAGMATLDPVTTQRGPFWEEKASQALEGGGIGAVAGPLGYLAGRAINPLIAPNVRALHNAGVEVTPGQALGGVAQRLENGLMSMPVVGDQVIARTQDSFRSLNRTAANRTLANVGEELPANVQPGREMVGYLRERGQAAYDEALNRASAFLPDEQFAANLGEVGQMQMPPSARQEFMQTLRDRVVSRFQQGPLDPQAFKTIDAELGSMAAERMSTVGNAGERELGRAYGELQKSLRDLFARQNPEAAPLLRAADAFHGDFLRVQGAAAATGAAEGVFTPAQLSASVRGLDRSARRGAFARGEARMQDLSDAAKDVLPSRVPDSGTAFRAIVNTGGIPSIVGGAATGFIPTNPLLLGAAASLAYTPAINRLISRYILAQRPGAVQAAGNALAGSGGVAGVPVARSLLGLGDPRLDELRQENR